MSDFEAALFLALVEKAAEERRSAGEAKSGSKSAARRIEGTGYREHIRFGRDDPVRACLPADSRALFDRTAAWFDEVDAARSRSWERMGAALRQIAGARPNRSAIFASAPHVTELSGPPRCERSIW